MVLQGAEQYNSVTFPHCSSDARKRGHVAVAMNSTQLQVHACDAEGNMEVGAPKQGGVDSSHQWCSPSPPLGAVS